MTKQTSLFCLFFLLVFYANSQPSTFMKTYINGNSGYAVRELNGNSYVVAGATDYYYNFHWWIMSPIVTSNIHLFKTTDDGTLIWEKILQLPGSRSLATWAEITADNGFIITGRINNEAVWPPDSNDVVLIKCNSDGIVQWSKKYDSGKDELGFCVRQTFDGGYAMSAFHDAVPTSLVGNTYAMLIKTDPLGNILWDRSYEFAVRDLDTGEGLSWVFSQTADSGYVMTGTTVGAHQADLYVIRTNSVGDVLWAKSYEHDNTVNRLSLGLDVIENSSGEIIIAGAMDKDHGLNELNYPFILKLSNTGALVQASIYNSIPAQPFQSGFSSVQQNQDGGYLFTGMGGYSGFGQQAQILKTDANFNMQWSRSYTNDGGATMGSRSGRSTSDGSYIFTGKKVSDGSVLLKTDFIGLVPCKNPDFLIELSPSINVVNRFPTHISGLIATDILFNIIPAGIDTSTDCPVTYTHLPVELISFSGNYIDEQKILLEWETASETNNDYFNVERSIDAVNYTKAGKVNGSGNSSHTLHYTFTDFEFHDVNNTYYRLKQIDFDGKEHLSKTIAVTKKKRDLEFLGYMSEPMNQMIKVYVNSNSDKVAECLLTDVPGKIVFRKTVHINKGMNEVRIENLSLKNGLYFLRINDGTTENSAKLIY
jgi:hypothetical protein